ncbi:MAG: sulfite exporter TauE/SafE family protein [Myxococcota bacterium]
MSAILALGFAIGMQHALEADHVAAVSSLVSGDRSMKSMVSHGALWGAGHTLILMVVGGAAVLLGLSLHPSFSNGLEFCVGLMLVMLGSHVLYRLWRDRVHFHRHRHGDRPPHFHAHSHKGERAAHHQSGHHHEHPDRSWIRPLVVGVMHGLAGTAAVVVLTAAAQTTPTMGLAYIGVFGAGSIAGMVAVTALIAVPMWLTASALTRMNRVLQGAIGAITISIGGTILVRTSILF